MAVERDVSLKRWSICVHQGSVWKIDFIRLELFAVIQTGTIAAVGVAFAKFAVLVCAFK
jgi:hypothetical protein